MNQPMEEIESQDQPAKLGKRNCIGKVKSSIVKVAEGSGQQRSFKGT